MFSVKGSKRDRFGFFFLIISELKEYFKKMLKKRKKKKKKEPCWDWDWKRPMTCKLSKCEKHIGHLSGGQLLRHTTATMLLPKINLFID